MESLDHDNPRFDQEKERVLRKKMPPAVSDAASGREQRGGRPEPTRT